MAKIGLSKSLRSLGRIFGIPGSMSSPGQINLEDGVTLVSETSEIAARGQEVHVWAEVNNNHGASGSVEATINPWGLLDGNSNLTEFAVGGPLPQLAGSNLDLPRQVNSADWDLYLMYLGANCSLASAFVDAAWSIRSNLTSSAPNAALAFYDGAVLGNGQPVVETNTGLYLPNPILIDFSMAYRLLFRSEMSAAGTVTGCALFKFVPTGARPTP